MTEPLIADRHYVKFSGESLWHRRATTSLWTDCGRGLCGVISLPIGTPSPEECCPACLEAPEPEAT